MCKKITNTLDNLLYEEYNTIGERMRTVSTICPQNKDIYNKK